MEHTGGTADEDTRAALDHAIEGVVILDAATLACVYANEAAARLFAQPRDAVLLNAHALLTRMAGDVPDETHAFQVEREWRHEGADRWIEMRRAAVPSGERRLIVWWLRDVTPQHEETAARKQAVRELQQLTFAVDKAGDSILLIDPQTMRYLHVNETAARIFELPRDQMMERGVAWAVEERGLAAPANLPRIFEAVIAAYPQPSPVTQRFARPDGSEVVVESQRQAVKVDGQWLIISVGRDATAARAVHERLERLRAALDQAPDALIVMDPANHRYVDLNKAAAKMYGLPQEELLERGMDWVGRKLGLRWGDELHELFTQIIALYPESFTEFREFPRLDGSSARIEWTRRAVRVDERWLIVNLGRDVTESHAEQQRLARLTVELNQRMTELARSNRELEQFAYVVSHDLSEPLRMVASYAQLIMRRGGADMDPDSRDFIGFIIDGARRMKQLIDDLLTYSRAGRAEATFGAHALDDLLDTALANLAKAIEESGAVIERPARLPVVHCSKTGMVQLFQNLVGNAIKFSRGRVPVVRIAAAPADGADWTFCVADNGIGIDPQYFERIFAVFQRLHARDQYEGTGIGLAICQKIVEQHGGRIWVESTPGEGARFNVALPKKRQIVE